MIQGDYTHETREYGRAFIQNLQARIRKLEAALTGMTWERDAIKDHLERSREMNRVRTTQLDGMSDAYEKSSQGRARDWREYEAAEAETLDDLGHLRMRIMQLERDNPK